MPPTLGRRRALGQHFLKSETAIAAIIEATLERLQSFSCRALLEIGPGAGALTAPLLDHVPALGIPFTLCERDPHWAEQWRGLKPAHARLRVECSDFLELPEASWLGAPDERPLGVVSNLPYSAATAILTRLARHTSDIPFMVLMFQAEVAQRLRAEPSTKAWGSLSIWLQNRWDVSRLCAVPPRAFSPPPEVDSEVVILTRRESPRIAVPENIASERHWEGLLRACFAHRRKMLRSCLPKTSPQARALADSGLDGRLRAEALEWSDWARLFEALQKHVSPHGGA